MKELPPTAGLPLRAADLLPWGDTDLASALARWLGVPQVQLTCSGTAALLLALQVLRRHSPERTEVVVPAYTCPLVALAVAQAGLQLRLCDLAAGTLDLHLPTLQALCGPRTLAVLPTHLCGLVTDVQGPLAVARAAGAWVIEDAAQALGARVQGQPLGLQGDIGLYSLAAGKGLTLYEGGVLVSAQPALRAALRDAAPGLLRPDARWELRRSAELLAYAACYRPWGLRWVYGAPLRRALARGDRVAAAGDDFGAHIPLHAVGRWRRRVGVRALARLADHWQAADGRWQRRRALLAAAGLQVLGDSSAVPGAHGVRPLLLLALPDPARREALLQRLWGAGCGVSLPFAAPLADYPRDAPWAAAMPPAPLPHARDLAGRLLAITNSAWLDDAAFNRLLAVLSEGSPAPRAAATPPCVG